MRFPCRGFLAALAVLCAGAADAQTREDFVRCRAIAEEARRLACYDALPLPSSFPRSKYETVPFEELESFALSYRGRLVEVEGWVDPGERYFLLKRDQQSARSLPIELRSLTRSEQQAVRDLCATGCAATVRGKVDPVNFTTGITADAIIVH